MATSVDVTVIIPTLDGERYLARVLDAIDSQEFDGTVETLVIDSGSSDATLNLVRARSGVRLHEIPNREFGHGRTRNLAASLANGRLLAYLTQDAIPIGPHWLAELVGPLDPSGSDAVAVMGLQVPRPDCVPLLKYEINGVFGRFGPPAVYDSSDAPLSEEEHDLRSFYSDVNSATRRDFVLETMPYRDLKYSEDMAFGADVIDAGYRKAWAPAAAVEHSNDLTLREYSKRIFDETMSLRRLGHGIPGFGRGKQLLHTGYNVMRDSARIIRDPDYGFGRTLYWLAVNPLFQVAKWQGYYRGSTTAFDDAAAIDAHSLESDRTRSARGEGAA